MLKCQKGNKKYSKRSIYSHQWNGKSLGLLLEQSGIKEKTEQTDWNTKRMKHHEK